MVVLPQLHIAETHGQRATRLVYVRVCERCRTVLNMYLLVLNVYLSVSLEFASMMNKGEGVCERCRTLRNVYLSGMLRVRKYDKKRYRRLCLPVSAHHFVWQGYCLTDKLDRA